MTIESEIDIKNVYSPTHTVDINVRCHMVVVTRE